MTKKNTTEGLEGLFVTAEGTVVYKTPERKRPKKNPQKQKGKAGERYFSDILSEIAGEPFQRIFASGAFTGLTNRTRIINMTQAQTEAQLGDINSPESMAKWLIWESKNYKEVDLHNMLIPAKSRTIMGWLGEVEYDVASALTYTKTNPTYREPIGFLCIKLNLKGSFVVGNVEYFKKVFGTYPIIENCISFTKSDTLPILLESGYGSRYFMTDFKTFFENNKDTIFKRRV